VEIKILWSDTALSQLRDIFNYYKLNASPSVARKLVKFLIESTILLESNPKLGALEPLLSKKPFEYRYLVRKNYKIIYRFNDNLVRIVAVFDCRQDPGKINELKG
jgi:toxin ParE1/3/4